MKWFDIHDLAPDQQAIRGVRFVCEGGAMVVALADLEAAVPEWIVWDMIRFRPRRLLAFLHFATLAEAIRAAEFLAASRAADLLSAAESAAGRLWAAAAKASGRVAGLFWRLRGFTVRP